MWLQGGIQFILMTLYDLVTHRPKKLFGVEPTTVSFFSPFFSYFSFIFAPNLPMF
jgi:hypothetical protein